MMDAELRTLLRQASAEAIAAIREADPDRAAAHQARAVIHSAEAVRRLAQAPRPDQGRGSGEARHALRAASLGDWQAGGSVGQSRPVRV
jgi:hypothetical protein